MEAIKKSIEKTTKTLETQKTLQAKVNDAYAKQQKAVLETAKQQDDLKKDTEKYRDAEGKWAKGTEAIQTKYESDLANLSECVKTADEEFMKATEALDANIKAMGDERDERMGSLIALRDFRQTVREVDAEMAAGMGQDYFAAIQMVTDANKQQAESSQQIIKESNEAFGEMAKGLKEANLQDAADRAAAAFEKMTETAKKNAEELKQAAEEEQQVQDKLSELRDRKSTQKFTDQLQGSGGIVGLGDIKKEMEDMVGLENERFKAMNPKATEAQIKANREEFLIKQKDTLTTMVEIRQKKELEKIQKERIAQIMKEKGVSAESAKRLAGGNKDFQKEDALTMKRHQETLDALRNMNQGQLVMINRMEEQQIKDAEKAIEQQNMVPAWAQKFIDGFQEFREGLGGWFKKDDGLFKTILLFLTVAVGAVLGYIWAKIQFIVTLLTHLPFGIGKAIGNIFRSAVGGVGGIFGKVGEAMGPFTRGLKAIGELFPSISGVLGQFGKAFSFGFRIVGKVFFYLSLAIDAIMGAYKGFQKLGDIRGMIIGAVAQIISGLTFGLLDFESIFDFLNNTFGTTVKGFVDATVDLVKGFYNLAVKPFVTAIGNIVKIFRGGEGIFTKIFKSIYEMVFAGLKYMVGMLIFQFVKIPAYIMKAIFYVLKFFSYDIPKMLVDSIMWLWNWITSGDWLSDLANFGEWLNNKFMEFFNYILDSLADALGELPIVGSYIKSALGGGTKEDPLKDAVEKTGEVIEDAEDASMALAQTQQNSVTKATSALSSSNTSSVVIVPTGGRATEFASSAPSYSASSVNKATTSASTATMNASNQSSGTVAINAPTNNMAGGGGEMPIMMSPTNNRNTEPTFRALLFQECPAL